MSTDKTVLALGADMKNRFLLAKGKSFRFGPHIGDLSEAKNFERFKREAQKATRRVKPNIIACDMHPGYFCTKFARVLSSQFSVIRLLSAQHHYAHIASVMEEHGLERPVIGVSFDGTGLGTDGNIWGGEFLECDASQYRRVARLRPFVLPGGEKAVQEPWRTAVSLSADALDDVLLQFDNTAHGGLGQAEQHLRHGSAAF